MYKEYYKTILIKTTDDWCPNFNDDEVRLSVDRLIGMPITYRVSVWGADDLGMEKDFTMPNPEEEAVRLFEKIKRMESVSFDILKGFGFVSF